MKRKLAILFIAAVSCVCCAAGLAACEDDDTTVTPNSDQTVTASGHVLTHYDAVAATCTTAGNSEYYYCTDCGKYFSDSAATKEIELSDTVIAALGHDYEADFTWTKTSDGYTATATQYCSRCNTEGETVEASVELTSKTAATCTEDGSIVYTATAKFNSGDETDTKTLTDPATGHTYSEDWESDDDYHWHKAICEHTDEISEKTAHNYVLKSGSTYECSDCGHTRSDFITSSSDTLSVGANYILLNATSIDSDGLESDSSYISGMTFKATESGVYTLSIPTDCKGLIYIYDLYSDLYRLGDSGYSDLTYSASFELAAGESLDINTIRPAEGVTLDTNYVFCLTIAYEYKEVTELGTEERPYSFNNSGYTSDGSYTGAADSVSVNLAAGGSYYFTVKRDSDLLTSVSFSSSDSTAFELYMNGTKIDYATYYFSSGSTATTFQLKNVSAGSLSNAIYCNVYQPSISTSGNELEITSAMLDSSNSITYYVTLSSSAAYTITLGSDTDSNAAVYYSGEKTANSMVGTESMLILGSGATTSSYNLSNITSHDKSYLITITYTSTEIPDSFKVYLNFESYDAEANADYTALTLGTAMEAAIDYYSGVVTVYYSFNAPVAGNYTLTLICNNTWSNVYQAYTKISVNGSSVSPTESGVHTIALNAGDNKIIITCNATGTLSTTLTSGGTVNLGVELVIGENTVEDGSSYYYTATTAGTYTFTISGTSGQAKLFSSVSDYTALLDEYESGESTYTVLLTAGQTVTFYVTNGGSGEFTLTVAKS